MIFICIKTTTVFQINWTFYQRQAKRFCPKKCIYHRWTLRFRREKTKIIFARFLICKLEKLLFNVKSSILTLKLKSAASEVTNSTFYSLLLMHPSMYLSCTDVQLFKCMFGFMNNYRLFLLLFSFISYWIWFLLKHSIFQRFSLNPYFFSLNLFLFFFFLRFVKHKNQFTITLWQNMLLINRKLVKTLLKWRKGKRSE